MSWTAILDRLAGVAGLEPWYYDLTGVRHDTSIEAKVLVLSALGFDVSSVPAASAGLARIEEDPWRRVLAPFVTTPARSPEIDLFVAAESDNRVQRLHIQLESGEGITNEFRPESLPLLGARDIDGKRIEHRRLKTGPQPIGYHGITLADQPNGSLLALTPETSYLPDRLAAGQRLWGVAAHLYTLRSDTDWGIGDFGALARLCASTGRAGGCAIALNPFHALFPERPEEASPYSPSSRLFLNPIYIDVASEAVDSRISEIGELMRSASRLRESPLIEYTAVWRAKLAGLEALFAKFKQQPEPPEYSQFVTEQGPSLERFALFAALAEKHGLPWQNWPADLRNPKTASEAVDETLKERMAFHRYAQFLADKHLRKATEEAAAAGMHVGIVRDLALGISPDGADAWMNQDTYASRLRCGAPPDDFQPKGQEWGVLPFNPLALRRSVAPFAELLRANMRNAGGLRIDHIIGLQRQFLVPLGAEAKAGCYVRFPLDDLLGILALESRRNRCLVIGEDLGTVPEGFRDRIHDMDIPGCAVLYFERASDGGFKPPSDYHKKAVATVSTHDLVPLAGYWEKRDIAVRRTLGIYGDEEARSAELQRDKDRSRLLAALAQAGIALAVGDDTPAHSASALSRAVHAFLASSSAQLFLARLDELLGAREQLNVPGTTIEVPNWRRKLTAGVDDPLLAELLNDLARICASHGRKS